MKKEIVLLFTVMTMGLTSCLRLDSQLFNSEKLTEYKFESYTGGRELGTLSANYAVADSLTNLVTFTSNSQQGAAKLYGVYLGKIQNIVTDTVILYCHGNAKHMDNYWNRAKLLAHVGGKHRYGVLMFDYRGYGMSEGKSSEKNMYADVDAALKWLQSNGLTSNRLIIYGYSLGSAPSTEVAFGKYSLQPIKLLLEAPFASSEVMVQDGSKLALPGSYFTSAKINNADKIKSVKIPFMWIHGTSDSFLSIKTHGEIVYKNYNGVYGEAHRITGAEHGDLPLVWGYQNYTNAVYQFITK
jgi:pimeloyl-ACP methyl ester carboxylesterase